jgi:hypothetical protein
MSASAGDYYDPRINTYDPISGLYYKAVEEMPVETGFLSSKGNRNLAVNINIFDPTSGTSTLLFKVPQKEGISTVIFETGFKNGEITFNGLSESSLILNNTNIEKRLPRNKLLVGVKSKDSNEITLFISSKKGGDLKRVVTVPPTSSWHIDVKNSKLRVVHQLGNGLRIDSYEW